jgi:hypothetical protein
LIDHLSGKARQEVLGRGEEIKGKPEDILKVLLRVFGDGDQLPMLLQRFYSLKQGADDIVTCSLNMVELFDRMSELDPTLKSRRNESLKGRFAETVNDEGLKRELRRLNLELPDMTFFELRDRAVNWLGIAKKCAVQQEVSSVEPVPVPSEQEFCLKKQQELIAQQQKQIDSLLKAANYKSKPVGNVCWVCSSPDHFKRDCPVRGQGGKQGQRSEN